LRWRIRHKLILGLLFVAGIMAVLLVGTLKGLLSYRSTMKSIDSKLAELRAAQRLQETVAELTALFDAEHAGSLNSKDILTRCGAAREALEAYRLQLDVTVHSGRDLDKGYDELALVGNIDKGLSNLTQAAQDAGAATIESKPIGVLPAEARIAAAVGLLTGSVNDLRDIIHTDLSRRIASSRADYRTSLIVVNVTSLVGLMCLVLLARLAHRWFVSPIRDLHVQVSKLAKGDFDSRIQVQSRDEMQDLADAFNDMTERLQAIYRDLARQVNERSRQLVRSERLAGVGFLAAGVAHEINNPLASIAFCSEALERRLNELLADRRHHPEVGTVTNYLNMIQQEAFRCKEITQKLLDFSRMGDRQRENADIAQLIQSVIEIVHHHQSYKGKDIRFAPRHQPRVQVNAPEIKSVILNLVVNALESMEEGGVLRITLAVQEDWAVMTFADTGCGMTAEVLENIFEPFFTRSRTGKGTGLGLSISHRVISQHGGEIEAVSDGPDQGSTFIVRLPLTATIPMHDSTPLSKAA
jgi:signal transduction histidine kinase